MEEIAEKVIDELDILAEEREQLGPKAAASRPPEHFVISGNPGTGKTQLASILAEAMAGIDSNRSNQIAEFSASQLAGVSYIGDAVKRFEDFVAANPGKVIFIDEAHTLADKDTYGRDVLRAIIPTMTKKGPDAPQYIFAGYPGVERLLGDIDPGFASRISSTFEMPDYTTDQLAEIAQRKIGATEKVSPSARKALDLAVASLPVYQQGVQEKFANGRGVERLTESVRKARLLRIRRAREQGVKSEAIAWEYTADDVVAGYGKLKLGPLKLPAARAPRKARAAA